VFCTQPPPSLNPAALQLNRQPQTFFVTAFK
jgi:hypothetical protein